MKASTGSGQNKDNTRRCRLEYSAHSSYTCQCVLLSIGFEDSRSRVQLCARFIDLLLDRSFAHSVIHSLASSLHPPRIIIIIIVMFIIILFLFSPSSPSSYPSPYSSISSSFSYCYYYCWDGVISRGIDDALHFRFARDEPRKTNRSFYFYSIFSCFSRFVLVGLPAFIAHLNTLLPEWRKNSRATPPECFNCHAAAPGAEIVLHFQVLPLLLLLLLVAVAKLLSV